MLAVAGVPRRDRPRARSADADPAGLDIVDEIENRFNDFYPNVENIQDIVEKQLVLKGHYEIAKAYILYRDQRRKVRDQAKRRAIEDARLGKLTVEKRDGRKALFNVKRIEETIRRNAGDRIDDIDTSALVREVVNNVYDRIPTSQIDQALILASASFIEKDPSYSFLAGRLLTENVGSTPWVLVTTSVVGVVGGACLWLAFFPPAPYLRWVRRRAPQSTAP